MFCLIDQDKRLYLVYPDSLAKNKDEKIVSCLEIQEYITMSSFESSMGVYISHSSNSFSFDYKKLIVLGNKSILFFDYLSWEECALFMKEKYDFTHSILLCIGVYDGKIRDLADIPASSKERKLVVSNRILSLLKDNILVEENKRFSLIDYNMENADPIKVYIQIAVESCLVVKSFGFLFVDVLRYFSKIEKQHEFHEVLEPYIFNGYLKDYSVMPEYSSYLFNYYSQNNNFLKYNLFVEHFYPESIYESFASNLCREKVLVKPLLYITSHSSEKGKYIDSLVFLVNNLKSAKSKYELNKLPLVLTEDDLKLKEYLAIQLISSIDYIVNHLKRIDLLQDVLCFLLIKETYEILIDYSPSLYFQLIHLIVSNEKVMLALESKDVSIMKCALYPKLKYTCEYLTTLTVRDILVKNFSKTADDEVKLFFDQYVLLVYEKTPCNLELLCQAMKRLIAKQDRWLDCNSVERQEESIAFFDKKFIRAVQLNKSNLMGTGILKDLYRAAANSAFERFSLYLLQKERQYVDLVKFAMRPESRVKINIFQKINSIFKKIKNHEDEKSHEELETYLVNQIEKLANLNFIETINLVEHNLGRRKLDVIKQLAKFPQVQLNFVEKYIQNIDSSDNEKFTRSAYSSQEFNWLFSLHVELLCQLEPAKVISTLQQNKSYNLESTLETCKKYKNYDAILYLFIHSHRNSEAIDMCIEVMNMELRTYTNNVLFNRTNDEKPVENFKKMTDLAIKVCEQTSAINEAEGIELWMTFCDFLININSEINRNSEKNERKDEMMLFKQVVSDSVSKTLNSMSLCVKVDSIVDVS